MGFISLLSVRAWASLGLVLALTGLAGWSYFHILDSGVAKCELRHLVADAKAETSAHKEYLAAVNWGNQISADLVVTQRKLNDTKQEYLAYANGISGNCPADLGMLSNSAATGIGMSATSNNPINPSSTISPPTIAASIIGTNIAENYGRANACIAQLNSLIDWYTKPAIMNK